MSKEISQLQARLAELRKSLDKFDANPLAECNDEVLEVLRAEMAEVAHQLHCLISYDEKVVELRGKIPATRNQIMTPGRFLRGLWSRARAFFSSDYRILRKSTAFDRNYYFQHNKDLAGRVNLPILHYLLHGEREGRRPRLSFNPNTYADSATRRQLRENNRSAFAHAIRQNKVRPQSKSDQLRIKVIVSEDGHNPLKGDIATAHALAAALKEYYGQSFRIDVRGPSDQYNTVGYDVVIAMMHDFDPALVTCPYTLKAGWIRNWPHAWLNHANSSHWDFFFVASEAGLHLVQQECDVPGHLLRQSVDTSRVTPADSARTVDVSYAGNRWMGGRPMDTLDGSRIPGVFELYGIGWDECRQLARYCRGTLTGDEVTSLYKNSRMVIDDAHQEIAPYGFGTSRVLHALQNGALPITNDTLFSQECFAGALPTYDYPAELYAQLEQYHKKEELRSRLVQELQGCLSSYFSRRLQSQHAATAIYQALNIQVTNRSNTHPQF